VMALSVDSAASNEVAETIRSLDGILSVRQVVL
jgi:hypothetical protein